MKFITPPWCHVAGGSLSSTVFCGLCRVSLASHKVQLLKEGAERLFRSADPYGLLSVSFLVFPVADEFSGFWGIFVYLVSSESCCQLGVQAGRAQCWPMPLVSLRGCRGSRQMSLRVQPARAIGQMRPHRWLRLHWGGGTGDWLRVCQSSAGGQRLFATVAVAHAFFGPGVHRYPFLYRACLSSQGGNGQHANNVKAFPYRSLLACYLYE